MSMDAPQKDKAIKTAPAKKADDKVQYFYPPNSQCPVAVTVEASTQEEADELYQKIVKGDKI